MARLRLIGQTLIARWAGDRFVGVHMAWGAVNELTTAEAYMRLMQRTEHPILRELLHRIMKDERRHFAFYFNEARMRLSEPKTAWLTSNLIRRFFEPVGADIRDLSEVDAVAVMVFGDESGLEIVRGVDRRIATLPGLAGFRGLENSLHRSKARFGESLGRLELPDAPARPWQSDRSYPSLKNRMKALWAHHGSTSSGRESPR